MMNAVVVSPSHENDGDYQMLLSRVRQRVVIAASKGPFVTTCCYRRFTSRVGRLFYATRPNNLADYSGHLGAPFVNSGSIGMEIR